MIPVAWAEFFITLWSALLCCRAICNCCKRGPLNTTVLYNPTPVYQQQAVVNPGAITVGVYTQPHTNPVQGQMAACK